MSDQSPGRSVVPTIRIPEDDLGKAMLALNPAQRAFVYFKVFGLMNNKDAAVAAGYSDTGDSAKVMGYRLAHREDIQAAIREETRKLATAEGPPSIAKIIYLRDKAKDEKVQLKAAQDLLDRCGLGAVTQSHVTVDHTDNRPTAEIMSSLIKEVAEFMRLPETLVRTQMLNPRKIIDAQWEEVPKPEPTPAQLRENELQRARRAMNPEQLTEHKRLTRERQTAEAKARYAAAQAEAKADDDLFTEGW